MFKSCADNILKNAWMRMNLEHSTTFVTNAFKWPDVLHSEMFEWVYFCYIYDDLVSYVLGHKAEPTAPARSIRQAPRDFHNVCLFLPHDGAVVLPTKINPGDGRLLYDGN